MYLRDRIKELELLGDGGSGDRTVFDKLKSKIESDRRQRLDLEAAVLDRDNTCIEMKHELDLKNQEILNMKRIIESDTKRPTRILHRELTAVRGKNLEATVKTLEEVVQKLRLDNENLCRRLASSGVEMKAQKDESFGLTKRASVAEQEIKFMHEKMQRLRQSDVTSTSFTSTDQSTIKSLKATVAEQRTKLVHLQNVVSDAQSKGSSNSSKMKLIKKTQDQLLFENQRLRKELSAFDADFFDEIENLKSRHREALEKLRFFEGRH